MIELQRADQDPLLRALRHSWAGELTDRNTGRPREHWHVSDYPNPIDANELRRRAHLYPVRVGVRCRRCAGIGYREGSA
jgi:hypothetical protein